LPNSKTTLLAFPLLTHQSLFFFFFFLFSLFLSLPPIVEAGEMTQRPAPTPGLLRAFGMGLAAILVLGGVSLFFSKLFEFPFSILHFPGSPLLYSKAGVPVHGMSPISSAVSTPPYNLRTGCLFRWDPPSWEGASGAFSFLQRRTFFFFASPFLANFQPRFSFLFVFSRLAILTPAS